MAARLSTIWSENATYLVVGPSGAAVHASTLSHSQADASDWTRLLRVGGQQDVNGNYIDVQNVGGYTTLGGKSNEISYAVVAATAGTNLALSKGFGRSQRAFSCSMCPRPMLRLSKCHDLCRNMTTTSFKARGSPRVSPAMAEA